MLDEGRSSLWPLLLPAHVKPFETSRLYTVMDHIIVSLRLIFGALECIEVNVLLLIGVASKWKVKKQASKSRNVGPIGILYIGYLHWISNNL